MKGFEAEGFKTQVQPLSHFQEAYGLEVDGDEEGESADEELGEAGTDEEGSEEEGD